MKLNQKGFNVIVILLVTTAIGIVGVVGWAVFDRQNTTKLETSTTEPSPEAELRNEIEDAKLVAQSVDWTFYEPVGKEFSFRVADGWELRIKEGSDSSFSSTESLALETGTKGKVIPYVSSGRHGEFGCGLYWDFLTYDTDEMKQQYKETVEQETYDEKFYTLSGLEVRKRSEIISDATGGYSPVGTKYYGYSLHLNNKSIRIGYFACPDVADHHDIVEKVIRTIESN